MPPNSAKLKIVLFGLLAGITVAACDPATGEKNSPTARNSDVDPNLECAALISAASYLVAGGEAESDAEWAKRSLGAMMLHLNSYAIPRRLKEPEAFEALKARRVALLDELPAATVMRDARPCLRNSPR